MQGKTLAGRILNTGICILLAVGAVKSHAAPTNDYCSTATQAVVDVPYAGTTIGATGSISSTCGYLDAIDVWYRFTPPSTGVFVVSLCGSSFDTTLAIFDGCSGTEIACNDDFCGLESQVTLSMTAGQPCYIRIAGYSGDTGNYTLLITETVSDVPHDECINAIEVFENTLYLGDTTGAAGGSTSGCASSDTADVWHKFTPNAAGLYSFSLCGSAFDTTIALYDSCGGTEIVCNDDFCDYQSQISALLNEASTYYIRVAGYGGATGPYQLLVVQEQCDLQDEPNNPAPADKELEVQTDTMLLWNDAMGLLTDPAGSVGAKIIYGDDDRLEQYEVTDPILLTAGASTAMVMPIQDLQDNHNGTYSILPSPTLAEYYSAAYGSPLCSDEPYRDQPVPGFCSAFLVAPDIIATAGHCVRDSSGCVNAAFVFGFVMIDASTASTTFDESQVYFCSEIIARQETSVEDWALVRLDREVTGHTPLSIRRTGKIDNDADVTIIGHPMGLPRKYASGAAVRDNTPAEYFEANIDSYGGNSGSAVFDDATMQVEGILVRGNTDFVADGPCDRSNVCPDTGCPDWEDITRTTVFSDLVPSFDVYLGTDPQNMALACADVSVEFCNPGPLQCGTTYYWQVDTKNQCGSTQGPIWQFTTRPAGDLDHDCSIHFADYCTFAARWADDNCNASNAWCDGADINSDTVVDFKDLRHIALNWLTTQ